ncbi:TrmH family RNA methyltransferase [Flavobacterium orientale]|uniref:tRNA (guanosine(18)-2'-O)-methyltransferase n=1 Tax=Flavobacterium orientale TaxID=1756020 RepID=A0A916Y0V8_9FLAO|nr:RNA methyltransferase [Flavobacterium orientale]GGD26016.1 tRNA (guanosine(18)-2'-O)-methyltransferase [Flavobacterium orientale]
MNELLQTKEYLEFLESFITENRKKRIDDVLHSRTKHFTVVVEDVYQLHNTSAVMRSCEVFGIQEIQVIEQKFGKQIDSEIALGAQKWVDIYRFENSTSCMKAMRKKGYQIIATTPHDQSTDLTSFAITKPSALFFGTEKDGLSEEVLQEADGMIHIPMVGFTESLNISVSAAILLQHLSDRLRKSTIDWRLTPQEILLKKIDWAQKSIKDYVKITERFIEENSN